MRRTRLRKTITKRAHENPTQLTLYDLLFSETNDQTGKFAGCPSVGHVTEEFFIGDDEDSAQTGAYDIWEASNVVFESKHANSDRPVENSGAPCVRRQSFPAR